MSNTEDCSIYFYEPSLAAAILFTVLYALPTVFTLHRINNYRTWYFICVVFGGAFEVAGYALRIGSLKKPCDVALYATSQSLIVIAPLLVAAGNYLMLGRLMLAVLPVNDNKIFGLKPTMVTAIFVGIDVVSILIQASGSGIASSNDWEGSEKEIGVDVLIAGLAIQVATVIIFLIMCWKFSDRAYFGRGMREDAPDLADRAFKAVCISTTLIAIRSIYRLVEFAMGIDGYPFSNEWIFYVFEAVPMLFAITIFCLWFPPAYLPRHKFGDPLDAEIGSKRNGATSNAPATPIMRSAAASRAQSRAPSRAPSMRGTASPGYHTPGHHTPGHLTPAVRSAAPSIREQYKPTSERYA